MFGSISASGTELNLPSEIALNLHSVANIASSRVVVTLLFTWEAVRRTTSSCRQFTDCTDQNGTLQMCAGCHILSSGGAHLKLW